jgi:hypothetical protein
VALRVALYVALSVALYVALSVALSVALRVALAVALAVALRVALSVALAVALSVALRVALAVALSCFRAYRIAAEAPYAKAITSGEGTIITLGSLSPATAYSPLMAGMILSGSIGSVRMARLIQSLECSSMRAFSAGVMPPVARSLRRTILVMFIPL